MKTGYFAFYHFDKEPGAHGLPDMVMVDTTLDGDLERITSAIREWILAGAKEGPEASRHFNLTLVGPIPAKVAYVRRTPEEKLAASKNPRERFENLGEAALSRFDHGDYDTARSYVLELQRMIPRYPRNVELGAVMAKVNIVLGRIALRDGQVEAANDYLREAGRVSGSPTLCSFGPNMSLAKDLLLAGHPEAVLDYFELCKSFWPPEFSKLDDWAADVKAGLIPEFGANLVY